jgi:hypothetical protein
MNLERWVGSLGARLFTVAVALACVSALALHRSEVFPSAQVAVFVAGCVLAFLTLLGFIHCFAPVYAGWMKFSKALHAVAVTVLFSICYLLVVPFFVPLVWLLDPLRLRKRSGPATWIQRPSGALDLASLERMG